MKITLCILILALPLSGQQEQTDPYSINFVRSALRFQVQRIHQSFVDKNVARLGDRIVIAILKIYGEEELSNPQNVAAFLPVIQQSFSQPQFITTDADKQPSVTLMLLKHLQQSISDVRTEHLIEDTIKFVEGKTASLATN